MPKPRQKPPTKEESFEQWMGKKTKARMTLTNPDWETVKPGTLIEARSGAMSIVWKVSRRDFKRSIIFMVRPTQDEMQQWLKDQRLIGGAGVTVKEMVKKG